jgi:hypothetical protein
MLQRKKHQEVFDKTSRPFEQFVKTIFVSSEPLCWQGFRKRIFDSEALIKKPDVCPLTRSIFYVRSMFAVCNAIPTPCFPASFAMST